MKLLTRTVQNYVIFSALLLIVSTPVFYLSIQRLFVHELDNELLSHKSEFYQTIPLLKTKEDLDFFTSMNDEFILKDSSEISPVDLLLSEERYDVREDETHPFRILRTRVEILGRPYMLEIRESLVNAKDLVVAIVAIQVILISLLLVGFVLINRKLSRTIWGPFYGILDSLKKFQIDKHTAIDLPRSTTAEFRDLSFAITQLVNKNREVFQSQKEFTENASHELQTPLAICRSKLELLAQTRELTEPQAELVASLFSGLERISRLNKNLLLLSKIENRQFLDVEEVDLCDLVDKYLEVFSSQIQDRKIQIKSSVDKTTRIKANPVLLDVLVNNLISNAVRHSCDGSTINIEGSSDYFRVSNPGEPLSSPEKVFERFHRETRTVVGNGLGLSIVKKICDVAGYRLDYHYADARHHFGITF